jgi:hypothetical protein
LTSFIALPEYQCELLVWVRINLSSVICYYLLSIHLTSIIYHLSDTKQQSKMTAPFIPPPIDSSAPTVGTLSSLSLPALEETGPVANTAPIVPGQPRPVVPAEEIGVPPAKALDPVTGGPGLFEKAKEIGMPVSRVSSRVQSNEEWDLLVLEMKASFRGVL